MDAPPSGDWVDVTQIKGLFSFIRAIDFRDPWLQVLIGFHVLITAINILTRHRTNAQIALFMVLLGLVYFSETINELGAKHWSAFSRQQYFDSNGLFISVVFSMPILLNCFALVGGWLYQTFHLMAKVKRAQLKDRRRKEAAAAKKAE